MSGLCAIERAESEREVAVLRSTRRLGEKRERRLTDDVEIERVRFRLLRCVHELDLGNLVPQRRSYETRECTLVGQPRHEHRQARIHWR